jgi:hypothetical protein
MSIWPLGGFGMAVSLENRLPALDRFIKETVNLYYLGSGRWYSAA